MIVKTSQIQEISVEESWEYVFKSKYKVTFESRILPGYLKKSRWFNAKAYDIYGVQIQDYAPFKVDDYTANLLQVEVQFTNHPSKKYVLPLAFYPCVDPDSDHLPIPKDARLLFVSTPGIDGLVYECMWDKRFQHALFDTLMSGNVIEGLNGQIEVDPGSQLISLRQNPYYPVHSVLLKAEQSNSSVAYDDQFILKIYRSPEEGENPEIELSRFLTDETTFTNTPQYYGCLNYHSNDGKVSTLGVLQKFIPNDSDAWTYVNRSVGQYFDFIHNNHAKIIHLQKDLEKPEHFTLENLTPDLKELIGESFLKSIKLLGKRTGEMHLALASSFGTQENLSPETLSLDDQKQIAQIIDQDINQKFELLEEQYKSATKDIKKELDTVIKSKQLLKQKLESIKNHEITASKIRIHGDYHLGQVLYTIEDFMIIDFEGEPNRTMRERRQKHSAYKDIAGMLRSFHYAAFNTLLTEKRFRFKIKDFTPWAGFWYKIISDIFLEGYYSQTQNSVFIPRDVEERATLLQTYMLEKVIYETGYELNNRPDWLIIPIKGIQEIIAGH